MKPQVSPTRERLLAAIAARVPAHQITEVHFFQGIRQGGVESGVAVVAARRSVNPATASAPPDMPDGADAAADTILMPAPVDRPERHTVFTAHYRLTIKGPDRGKWEATVVEEADAPLTTVETVVRGVQRRSGDVDDPERLDGDTVREILG